ncbi:MAG: hypothetical protein EAZ97_09690 [Bacteroidetes bacterium]|nr:MAG: hypothetical protein EAZ97_09690 [Bacteroidota bacterium]
MFLIRNYLFIIFCICFAFRLSAQSGNSPYSRIGLGDLQDKSSLYSAGMAGIGISNSSQAYINLTNPALLSKQRLTTFDTGFLFEAKSLETAASKQNNQGGNLGYLAFAFPVARKSTLGIGLLPYSRVNYTDFAEEKLPNNPTFVKYTYNGSGGITQAYLSLGTEIFKGFSVGGQMNYNFGAIRTEFQSLIDEPYNIYISEKLSRTNFSDISYRYGFTYNLNVGKNKFINFGFVSDLQAVIGTKRLESLQKKNISDNGVISSDTLSSVANSITIPPSYGFGISFDKPFHYMFGIDFKMQDWTSYKGLTSTNDLGKSYKIAIGGEWTPNLNALNGYFKRVSYRLGAFYSKSPIILKDPLQNDVQLEEMGVTGGFSLPVGRGLSSLNIAIEAGKRGTTNYNLIYERYIKVKFGLTINDSWFEKRKIF